MTTSYVPPHKRSNDVGNNGQFNGFAPNYSNFGAPQPQPQPQSLQMMQAQAQAQVQAQVQAQEVHAQMQAQIQPQMQGVVQPQFVQQTQAQPRQQQPQPQAQLQANYQQLQQSYQQQQQQQQQTLPAYQQNSASLSGVTANLGQLSLGNSANQSQSQNQNQHQNQSQNRFSQSQQSYSNNDSRGYGGGGNSNYNRFTRGNNNRRGGGGGGYNSYNSGYGGGGGGGRDGGGDGGGGGGSSYGTYSTYTDNAHFRPGSTQRDAKLEKELFHSTAEVAQGINFSDYDKIPVEASGENVPKAMTKFEESGLVQVLLENIVLCKYLKPTPIQKYSIPCVLNDRDLMACAQTGSGKTAAFLVPIIHQLFNVRGNKSLTGGGGGGGYNSYRSAAQPLATILSPTRELAIQIHQQARKFLYRTGMRSAVVYGGADWRNQAKSLRYGVEILVATPGRLNDFIERGLLRMTQVGYCVLDEADRMLDMGFMPQIKNIIRQMPVKQDRRTLMFSATFPLEIQKLAQDFLHDYIFVAIGRVGSTNEFITQKLRKVENWEKTEQLLEVLAEVKGLALIFVEKKRDAWRVERELIQNGFDAMSIHGDRTQSEREHALKLFRSAKVRFLVATDVAARGLDIPNVMWVINYDLPNNIDSYVHRIGRTGRCGNNGTALSFVNESNKPVLKDMLSLLQENKAEVPQWFSQLCYKSGGRNSRYGGGGNRYRSGGGGGQRYNNRGGGGGGGGGGYYSGRRYNNQNGGGNRFGGRDFRHRSRNSDNAYRSYDGDNQNDNGGGGGRGRGRGGGGGGGGSNWYNSNNKNTSANVRANNDSW